MKLRTMGRMHRRAWRGGGEGEGRQGTNMMQSEWHLQSLLQSGCFFSSFFEGR
jgi:hypothetical protein